MRELLWRPRAHLDRESIALYLGCECNNPKAARAAMGDIDKALDFARWFPEAGRGFSMGNDGEADYRRVLAGSYVVFYKYDAETLTVYRVLHQRQDIDTYALMELRRGEWEL